MNKTIIALSTFALTAGGVVSWVLLTRPAHEPARITSPVSAEEPAKSWRDRVKIAQDGMSPAEIADTEYANLQDPKLRLELIRWVGDQEWAGHKTPVLRKALIADTDEAVQLEALDRCIKLAEKSGQSSIDEVIRAGLSAANFNVQAGALKQARLHPSADLVPDLILIAEGGGHRSMALNALAFTDDDRARAKVIEVASREDGEKSERIRAIALLSKVKGEPAYQLLGQLAGSLDEEIRKVALEALAARDVR